MTLSVYMDIEQRSVLCLVYILMYKCNKREGKKGGSVTKECQYIYKEEEEDEDDDAKVVSVECSL